MTPRERIRKVISHEIPDRVPNGLGGCETEGFHVLSYDTVQKLFGVQRKPPRIGSFMVNAVFEPEVLDAIEGDIIMIASPHLCNAPLWGRNAENQWKEQEFWGKTFRVPVADTFKYNDDGSILWENTGALCPPGGYYFDWPGTTDLFADFEYPNPDDYNPLDSFTDEFLRDLEETARDLFQETNRSLWLGETVTDLQFQPGGRIGWMVLLNENPALMKEYLAKTVEASLKQISLIDQAVGKYVDVMLTADDMGDNRGVTIGDNLWREIYKPFYIKLWGGWHARTRMKINLHCCGSIYGILEDLIECGVDVYGPVQISGHNMEPAKLKEKAGNRLVFYGGDYDSQMMKACNYDEVYEHVTNNITILKAGGNHIFAGVHNLPPDMPEAHVRAFFKAWHDRRDY
jgi:uroporphyrinogen decarboxylase